MRICLYLIYPCVPNAFNRSPTTFLFNPNTATFLAKSSLVVAIRKREKQIFKDLF